MGTGWGGVCGGGHEGAGCDTAQGAGRELRCAWRCARGAHVAMCHKAAGRRVCRTTCHPTRCLPHFLAPSTPHPHLLPCHSPFFPPSLPLPLTLCRRLCVCGSWQLLAPDPGNRIAMAGIMSHPWFLEELPANALQMNDK